MSQVIETITITTTRIVRVAGLSQPVQPVHVETVRPPAINPPAKIVPDWWRPGRTVCYKSKSSGAVRRWEVIAIRHDRTSVKLKGFKGSTWWATASEVWD